MTELHHKEKLLKIGTVVTDAKARILKQEERTKFVGAFACAKNLIEKQMKVGQHLKNKKGIRLDNKKRVAAVQSARNSDQVAIPLKTKVYGGFEAAGATTSDMGASVQGPNGGSTAFSQTLEHLRGSEMLSARAARGVSLVSPQRPPNQPNYESRSA